MPRPPKDFDQFRDEIERRLAQGHTQSQIRNWLAARGVRVSKNTLSTRIVSWKASRHSRTADSNPALLAAIETEYHTTHHDDRAIAEAITAQGLHTTERQVKRLRLANGWRHRHRGDNIVANLCASASSFARRHRSLLRPRTITNLFTLTRSPRSRRRRSRRSSAL